MDDDDDDKLGRRAELNAAGRQTRSRREELDEAGSKTNPFVDFAQQYGGAALDIIDNIGDPTGVMMQRAQRDAANNGNMLAPRNNDDLPERRPLREQFGIPEKTDTKSGRAGTLAMESTIAAVPVGKVSQAVGKAPEAAGKIRTFLQNSINAMGNRFRSAPATTAVAEGFAGGVSGASGVYAAEKYPDSDAAQLVGEILGGSSTSLIKPGAKIAGNVTAKIAVETGGFLLNIGEKLPSIRAISAATRVTGGDAVGYVRNANAESKLPSGTRSSQRIDRATGDRQGAALAMDESMAGAELLTPAQRTGDAGILSMEKSYLQSTDRLRTQSDEQITAVNDFLKRSMQLEGNQAATEAAYEDVFAYHQFITNYRIRSATALADQRIAEIKPRLVESGRSPRESANIIAKRELTSAFDDARKHENSLYDKIDQEAIINVSNGRKAAIAAVERAKTAGAEDVHKVIRNQLLPDGDEYAPLTTVGEIRAMQTKLRESARVARAGGHFNEAAISDDVADALVEDIATMADGGEAVRLAVDYSRYKSEVFRQGTVGKLLGYVKTGEGVISEGMTLERTLGGGGPGGREAIDELFQAQASPEMRQSLNDFIRQDFLSNTVREGQLNRSEAVNYLAKNEEMLNRVPEIRQQFQAAIDAGDTLAVKQSMAKRVDLSQSRAAMFIRQEPKTAFNDIFADGVRSPASEMRKLMNMTAIDETGQAAAGLRSAFSEHLIDMVTDKQGDILEGAKLDALIRNPRTRGAIEAIYTKEQFLALNRINTTALRMDSARGAKASTEGVLRDTTGKVSNLLSRVIGAAAGRELSSLTGGGTLQAPAIMSQRFAELVSAGVNNPAKELLISAMNDTELMRIMLTSELNEGFTKQQTQRLNAWAAGLLIDRGLTEEEDQ